MSATTCGPSLFVSGVASLMAVLSVRGRARYRASRLADRRRGNGQADQRREDGDDQSANRVGSVLRHPVRGDADRDKPEHDEDASEEGEEVDDGVVVRIQSLVVVAERC